MAKQEKEKLIKRLKSRWRLTIINETTFEERVSTILTPLKVISFFVVMFLISGLIVYSITSLSPLKQYLVPGFTDFETREQARESRLLVDSLLAVNSMQEAYIDRIKVILSGGVIEEQLPDTLGTATSQLPDEYVIAPEDSILRAELEQSAHYTLNIGDEPGTKATQLLFKPLNGTVSGAFDPEIKHFGIDVVAPKNEVVKAVQDGTVTLASYTTDGGYVIQVQHAHNLISVYKHNSALFKKTGESVVAGESIAVIGDTGDHTDGPHLHFELWQDGNAVDPAEYFEW